MLTDGVPSQQAEKARMLEDALLEETLEFAYPTQAEMINTVGKGISDGGATRPRHG